MWGIVCKNACTFEKTNDCPIFTLKRFVTSDIKAEQDIILKQIIRDAIYELDSYISRGFHPLYIDESHWDLGVIAGRARSEIRTKPICYSPSGGERVIFLAAM